MLFSLYKTANYHYKLNAYFNKINFKKIKFKLSVYQYIHKLKTYKRADFKGNQI